MTWFVHYSEKRDYDWLHDFVTVLTKEQALAYIEQRMKLVRNPTLSAYTLIEGQEMTLETVEYVSNIKLKVGKPR